MKRTTDKETWRSKLTEEGVRYLEEYRLEKLQVREKEQKPAANLLDRIAEAAARMNPPAASEPKLDDLFAQNPAAVEQYNKLMREIAGPMPPPSTMDLWKAISSSLDQAGVEGRLAFSMISAIGIHMFWEMFYEIRRRHYGNSPLDTREYFWAIGTALRNIGEIVRTGEFELMTKGRVNVELVDLIQEIRRRERQRLSYRELRDALEYVAVYTPNEEWLRVFIHRARKKGWLE